MTRIVGIPRKRSVYATASSRKGNSTGPGSPRRTAIPSAKTRISASAIRKIRMFSRKARATSGNESTKSCRSKKAFRTSGHPAERTIAKTTIAIKTSVLATATPTLRAPLKSPRIRDPRLPRPLSASALSELLEDGRVRLAGQPLLLDLRKRAVRLQGGDRLVDAGGEAVVLRKDEPEVLRRAHRRELAHDRCLGDLHRRDVEGRRQVDDDAVDLMGLQRRVDVVRRVVDRRLLVGLDVPLDVVVARRPDLSAELVLLHVGARLGGGDRGSLQADERLVDVVVGPAEVDALRTRGRERDLVDVEGEALGAGLERLVEWDDDPVDVALVEAELVRDGVGDGALEPLPRGRIADLPRRAFRRRPAEPGRKSRVVGADRQLPVLDQVQVAGLAARARLRGGGLLRAAAPRGRECEQARQP